MQPVAFIWVRTKDNPELTKIDNQIDVNCLKTLSNLDSGKGSRIQLSDVVVNKIPIVLTLLFDCREHYGTRRICIPCGENPRQSGEAPQNRLRTPRSK